MNHSTTPEWERLCHFHHSTRKQVNLLVSLHADAAAASLTITALLKASLIDFSIHPIGDYEVLTEVVGQTSVAQDYLRDELRAQGDVSEAEIAGRIEELFLLIGFGAEIELVKHFDFSRHVVVVLDSHRPFQLSTLRQLEAINSGGDGVRSQRLMVWGLPQIQEEVNTFFRRQREEEARVVRRYRLHGGKRARQGSEGEQKRARRDDALSSSDHDSLFSSDTSDDDDSDEMDSLFSGDSDSDVGQPHSQEEEVTLSQDQYIHWQDPEEEIPAHMVALYEAIDSAGKSCAVVVYELSILLGRAREVYLWHAAVGVGDLLRRRLIDYGAYLVAMRPLHDAVSLYRTNNGGALEERSGGELNQPQRRAQQLQLRNMDDPQLLLLRHINLWESIWLHPRMAAVLGLHHVEDGEGFLSQLLASRCGVSRVRAQQPWREQPYEVQQDALPRVMGELQHIVERKAAFSSLPCQVRTVARSVGYSAEVSTFDACILFDAVLCSNPPDTLTVMPEADSHLDQKVVQETLSRRLRDYQRSQFWKACQVLDVDPNHKDFSSALQEAVYLQRCVADATSALMQPGMVQSTKGIHYAQPGELAKTTSALESFHTVFRLRALSERLLYTLTVERGAGRCTPVRPLLLSCTAPRPRYLQSSFLNLSSTTNAADRTAGGEAGTTNNSMSGVQGGEAAARYTVLLAHEGCLPAMIPSPSVSRFYSCIKDEAEYDVTPVRPYPAIPLAVTLEDRESTVHTAELLHLRSLQSWNPHRDRIKFLRQAALRERAEDTAGEEDTDGVLVL